MLGKEISFEIIDNFLQENDISSSQLEKIYLHFRNGGYELKQEIVGAKEFFTSSEYMNAGIVLYPVILEALVELCSGEYDEALLTGAIGSGKSSIAIYAMAYQAYLLSCYKCPQSAFGLDPASELLIVFQSINASLAKAVDYNRFRAIIKNAPYFQKYFPFDKSIVSEMRFPNNILVKPVSGEETAALGQNCIGATS